MNPIYASRRRSDIVIRFLCLGAAVFGVTWLSLILFTLVGVLGLTILTGFTGLISLGHVAFLMIGAYATYMVQNLFKAYAPGVFGLYLVVAIPVMFAYNHLGTKIREMTLALQVFAEDLVARLAADFED